MGVLGTRPNSTPILGKLSLNVLIDKQAFRGLRWRTNLAQAFPKRASEKGWLNVIPLLYTGPTESLGDSGFGVRELTPRERVRQECHNAVIWGVVGEPHKGEAQGSQSPCLDGSRVAQGSSKLCDIVLKLWNVPEPRPRTWLHPKDQTLLRAVMPMEGIWEVGGRIPLLGSRAQI